MQPLLNTKNGLLALMCLGAVACTTQEYPSVPDGEPQKIAKKATAKTSGKPSAKVSDEAKIFFESDYARDTEFSVNAKNVVGNQCSDFAAVKFGDRAGAGKAKSAKPAAVMITSASKLPVAVTARHHLEQKGLYSSCGPLTRVFVPEPNASYVAKLVKEKDNTGNGEETGLCVLDIQKIDAASGKREAVKTMAFGQCT